MLNALHRLPVGTVELTLGAMFEITARQGIARRSNGRQGLANHICAGIDSPSDFFQSAGIATLDARIKPPCRQRFGQISHLSQRGFQGDQQLIKGLTGHRQFVASAGIDALRKVATLGHPAQGVA